MCHAAMIPRPAVSTHSRPKAAGTFTSKDDAATEKFQHTAARRRLVDCQFSVCICVCFNTQPPEGGWDVAIDNAFNKFRFQHTAARRRLEM